MRAVGRAVRRPPAARLAYAAFAHTAAYDAAISGYLFGQGFAGDGAFPPTFSLAMDRAGELRYGENPHQRAALYRRPARAAWPGASLIHGKELSFNNLQDLSAAWDAVSDFQEPAAVIVKHATPCGAASAPTLAAAYELAFQGDRAVRLRRHPGLQPPGGRRHRPRHRQALPGVHRRPGLHAGGSGDPGAQEGLPSAGGGTGDGGGGWDYRRISGGLLLQDADAADQAEWRVVTKRAPTDEEMAALRFAWTMVRHVRSNAIALACQVDGGEPGRAAGAAPRPAWRWSGVGGGQTSRVDAVEMAVRKAADRAKGAVLASDAFFPFRDGVDVAAWGGVTAIVQPGGSKQDFEAIAAADETRHGHGLHRRSPLQTLGNRDGHPQAEAQTRTGAEGAGSPYGASSSF